MLARHAALLSRIEARFGVPRQILVAIWGLETDFGKGDMGKLPVIRTLATLAHDCRRSELFQGELLAALKIVQRGDLRARPDRRLCRRDRADAIFAVVLHQIRRRFRRRRPCRLRHSVPDVLASTANLLHTNGSRWARRTRGHANFEAMREWNPPRSTARQSRISPISWWGGSEGIAHPLSSLRKQRPTTTGRSCCAKAVERCLSQQATRRMGPGFRRNDAQRSSDHHRDESSFPTSPPASPSRSAAAAPTSTSPVETAARASLPIRMRGWFFSMPSTMRSAAAAGRGLRHRVEPFEIDCARRALSVMPTPVRELRAMLVATERDAPPTV